MPVISFVSSKGGVGKTTGAAILAGELAESGVSVVMVDADPNRPLVAWQGVQPLPERLTVVADDSAETIIDTIETARKQAEWVVVDLEGTATDRIGFAITRSDLVVIPVQGSILDANEAAKSIRLIRQMSKVAGREIAFRVYFSRVAPAIREKTGRDVEEQFAAAGIPVLPVALIDRAPFRAVFSVGGTIHTMSKADVSGLETARANALEFTRAVVETIRAGAVKKEAAA